MKAKIKTLQRKRFSVQMAFDSLKSTPLPNCQTDGAVCSSFSGLVHAHVDVKPKFKKKKNNLVMT